MPIIIANIESTCLIIYNIKVKENDVFRDDIPAIKQATIVYNSSFHNL